MGSRILSLAVFVGAALIGLSCKQKSGQQASAEGHDPPTPQVRRSDAAELPANARLTNLAWDAFNKGAYEVAINRAERCIDGFLGGAERKQLQLEERNAPPPQTGAASDQEKEAIFANGLLNDVATCLFIKGKSEEALGHRDEAIKAFQAASRYTYARCWDPNGWFWSPAEAAVDQLGALR